MKVKFLTLLLAFLPMWIVAQEKSTGLDNRRLWVQDMTRIARPVLENLAAGTLKQHMPFESLSDNPLRREVSYLEAVGRTICGIAPWLELGPDDTEEGRQLNRRVEFVITGTDGEDIKQIF